MTKWYTSGLCLLIWIGATGCAELADSSLPGRYTSSEACAGEVLLLSDDGTYSHSFGQASYVGAWEWQPEGLRNVISFSDFRPWVDPASQRNSDAIERTHVSTFRGNVVRGLGGNVTIIISDDYGCEFSKVND